MWYFRPLGVSLIPPLWPPAGSWYGLRPYFERLTEGYPLEYQDIEGYDIPPDKHKFGLGVHDNGRGIIYAGWEFNTYYIYDSPDKWFTYAISTWSDRFTLAVGYDDLVTPASASLKFDIFRNEYPYAKMRICPPAVYQANEWHNIGNLNYSIEDATEGVIAHTGPGSPTYYIFARLSGFRGAALRTPHMTYSMLHDTFQKKIGVPCPT